MMIILSLYEFVIFLTYFWHMVKIGYNKLNRNAFIICLIYVKNISTIFLKIDKFQYSENSYLGNRY